MAYFIEFGLSHGEGLYCEFAIVNKATRAPVSGDGVDHQFRVYPGGYDDYSHCWHGSQLIASTSNGLITEPQPGIQVLNIPPEIMRGITYGCFDYGFYADHRRNTVKCKMLAVTGNPAFGKLLFDGTISFGERAMPCPRVTLSVYPIYPANVFPTVAQVKMQLVAVGGYDAVEAALGPPTSPATISWNNGGQVATNGPLGLVIAQTLGYNTSALLSFFASALAIKT